MALVRRILCAIAARLHGACGWLAYRLGCRRTASAHFERVLHLHGDDFSAHVHLGRIAFDVGDYAGWRRRLEQARRLDPDRFARLRQPLGVSRPRLAGTTFDRADTTVVNPDSDGATLPWRPLRTPGSPRSGRFDPLDGGLDALLPGLDAHPETSLPRSTDRLPADRLPAGERLPDATGANDDCASTAERARLRQLGPIRPAELARCDLDELLRRLSS